MTRFKKFVFATVVTALFSIGLAGCLAVPDDGSDTATDDVETTDDSEIVIEEEVVLENGFTMIYDEELEGYAVTDFGDYSENVVFMEESLIDIIKEYKDVPVKAILADLPVEARGIYIPDTVVQLGSSEQSTEVWFENNPDLQKIEVGENNPRFTVSDGILYESNGDELDFVYILENNDEEGVDLSLPDGVKQINEMTGVRDLSRISNLKSISGAGVTKIYNEIFGECDSLEKVNLPALADCDGNLFGATNDTITDLTVSVKFYDLETDFTSLATLTLLPLEEQTWAYGPTKTPSVTKIVYGDGITEIRGVLAEGADVEEVELSSTVTLLNEYAFNNCNALCAIDLNGVETIKDSAFLNCDQFEGIYFPASVKEIGDYAFNGCYALGNARFDGDVAIGKYAFDNCYYITFITFGGKADIGEGAFTGCTDLETVTLGGETKIGKSAFEECSALYEIDFSEITEIGEYAFWYCSSLTAVSLENVEKLEEGAFKQCKNLTTADLTGVKSIGSYAFDSCKNLATVVLDDDVYNIGIQAFNGTAFYSNAETRNNAKYVKTYLLQYVGKKLGKSDAPYAVEEGTTLIAGDSLTNAYAVTLPTTLKSISDYALRNYASESLTIPDGVEYIGYQAFYRTKLKSVTIPGSVKKICDNAFDSSYYIEDVIIPEGVEEIGENAFKSSLGYAGYRKAVYLPESILKIGKNAFLYNDFDSVKVYYAGTSEQWDAIDKSESKLPDTYLPVTDD